jgi:DNA-directed RNA polymerase specialized sigma24 family protein
MAMNGNSPVVRKTGEQDALQKIVMHAFSLRPAFRRVFLLCDIQGFTVARAAAILGLSNAAVRTRLYRARREMNVRLAATQKEPGFFVEPLFASPRGRDPYWRN